MAFKATVRFTEFSGEPVFQQPFIYTAIYNVPVSEPSCPILLRHPNLLAYPRLAGRLFGSHTDRFLGLIPVEEKYFSNC